MQNKSGVRYIKAYEPWSTIFVTDLISVPLTPFLAAIKISPNAITIVSLVLGVCSGIAFGFGRWVWG